MRAAPSLIFLLLAAPGLAMAATGISVSIDRNEATLEDQLLLSVTIEGDRHAFPEVPTIPEFEVFRRGGASTQVQFGANGYRSSVEYTFILTPKKVGTFTISPFSVELEGTTYQSQPFRIRILPATAKPTHKRNLFIHAVVSKPNPVIQEQIMYTWRFFKRREIQIDSRSPRVEFPDFEGFVALQLEGQREYTTTIEGERFSVTEIRFVLFPQEEGILTIPPSTLKVDLLKSERGYRDDIFGDIFQRTGRVPKRLSSESIEVSVSPLPPPPANFTGIVGQFKMKSTLSSRSLATGESTTLTLRIEGQGNLSAVKSPFPNELKGFKIYHDKATNKQTTHLDGLGGFKEFRTALVPLNAGQFRIPSVSLAYFNPNTGSYEKTSSLAYPLTVRPGEGKEELNLIGAKTPGVSKTAVETLGDDILPLHQDVGVLQSSFPFLSKPPGRLFSFLVPPFFFFLLFGIQRRNEREQSDSSLRRRRLALNHALKNLKTVRGSPSEQITAGSTILREFIGDKLDLEGRALTPSEAADQLRRAQVQDSVIDQVSYVLKLSEAAQYGAAAGLGSSNEAPHKQIQRLLANLDKELSS